ncbi:MAG: hypothetical protein WBF75_12515, partial [Pseudonocardiaceae bacterium]
PITARTPATVWVCGGAPGDPDGSWPATVVARLVTSFTDPGARVVLVPWPALEPTGGSAGRGRARPCPGAPERERAHALTTVRGLDRIAQMIRIPPRLGTHHPVSRPYWIDLVGDPPALGDTATTPPPGSCPAAAPGGLDTGARVDLVITSLRPEHAGDSASDQVAGAAARWLRTGGVLAVLTHSDWSQGELVDPTGPMVAAAQNADLLYLQHIVLVHTPVRDGQFVINTATPDLNTPGMPTPHRRIHSDLLVFGQPHDHNPPTHPFTANPDQTGTLR